VATFGEAEHFRGLTCCQLQRMNWRGPSRYTSAKTTGGSIVGVIVESPEAALAKLAECQELGFSDVEVSDLDGKTIDIVTLAKTRRLRRGLV
jgi:hypothetical protein